jgi:hypothetical protein
MPRRGGPGQRRWSDGEAAATREERAKAMADLKNPLLIWTKGFLFLGLGLLASALLVLQAPRVTVVLLLSLAVWAFCRFYYFAFYVIQHYVDPTYRFSGLIAFLRYAFQKGRGKSAR